MASGNQVYNSAAEHVTKAEHRVEEFMRTGADHDAAVAVHRAAETRLHIEDKAAEREHDAMHMERLQRVKAHHANVKHIGHSPWMSVQTFVWKEVGGLYPYLDFPSGICFTIGSLLFAIPPFLLLVGADLSVFAEDWILMVGVIFFTLAKFFVESRAIYAEFYKAPSSRPGVSYHVGIAGFLIGGIMFAIDLIFSLTHYGADAESWASTVSSIFFILGSVAFVWNAWPHAKEDKFKSKTSNAYLFGSLLFLLGSLIFIIGSIFSFESLNVLPEAMYAMNFLGGLGFFAGAIYFLLLGYWEMWIFKAGPDQEVELTQVKRRIRRHENAVR